ncbi:MAG TPA: hypothetical protein VNM72_02635 [Blastocatellia bacterium]|nr:hypothetical protein [Blastocatellia bacterium]
MIIQKAHPNPHDHAERVTGAPLIEVVTVEQYRAAFTDKTAMHLVADRHFYYPGCGRSKLPDALAIAKEHGGPLPCGYSG